MNMKLMHITVHFEYAEVIEQILDDQGVIDYVVYPMLQGRDEEGKHEGSQVHPGNFTALQAQVPEEKVEAIFKSLEHFRSEKRAHEHLEAVTMPIERRL